MNLLSKVALVTGASKGIGRATAIRLAKEGCSVVINYKTDEIGANEVLGECNKHSKNNYCIQADVTDENQVIRLFDYLRDKSNRLDILVNNAGIFDEHDRALNIDAFENIYKNNLLSLVVVTKHSLNLMKEGKIVNVSSIHGRLGHGSPRSIAYSAFKSALESYTKNLAKSLAPKILVNALAPGRVLTPMWGNPDKSEQKELGQGHLIQRMIDPEEIADGIVFLIKNDAVCGEVLTIDGGMSLVTLG